MFRISNLYHLFTAGASQFANIITTCCVPYSSLNVFAMYTTLQYGQDPWSSSSGPSWNMPQNRHLAVQFYERFVALSLRTDAHRVYGHKRKGLLASANFQNHK
jgi:hypothetical protein